VRLRTLLMLALYLSATQAAERRNQREISAGSIYNIVPQIADGQGWKSTVVLANMESKAVSWTAAFWSDNGRPLDFEIVGRGKSSIFSGVLAANASVVLETPGSSASLTQGWLEVSASSSDDVGAMVIFGTRNIPGRPDYEASVPAMFRVDDDVVIPFDNSNGFVTSMAIVNSGSFPEAFTATVYDEAGNELRVESLGLAGRSKTSFATVDRWPESRNRRGTIALKGSLASITSLALRFHPGGAFTTVFPFSR
jgi:hypothetical protein